MFIEQQLTNKSLANRKPIYGIAINDSPYKSYNDQGDICPYYKVWTRMLSRCYGENKKKCYVDCFVCEEWHIFSAFKKWMKQKNWENLHLDKDIIFPGNKEYRPEYCDFVSRQLNNLIVGASYNGGPYMKGVSYEKSSNKYRSNLRTNGVLKSLGSFNTEIEANNAYRKAKSKSLIYAAGNTDNARIKGGLILHANLILNKDGIYA